MLRGRRAARPWVLLHAISRLGRPDGASSYLRLSTRGIDQSLAAVPQDPAARARRREQVVAGGYLLRAADDPVVTLVGMGAMMPEVLAAADRLTEQNIPVDVVCLTSPGLIFRALQASRRSGASAENGWILDQVFPASRAKPMVTVLDGHPHSLSFLATINRVEHIALGVSEFGQSGDIADVHRHHGIDADSIVRAALDAARR